MADSNRKLYLNGEFVPEHTACIPVLDRGFLFGDSIYEVIPAYGGRPFRWEHHLRRMQHSLDAIHITNPLRDDEWLAIFDRLTAQLPGQDQKLYLQITRGVMPARNHLHTDDLMPTVLVMSEAMKPRNQATVLRGIKAITLEDIRWQRCDIKATTLLANILARQQAAEQGADEAILVRDGHALEGSASNLFMVSHGLVITPPKDSHILPGITRDLTLELAAEAGVPFAEAVISEEELAEADEIWVTSSSREIMPVTELNGRPVGSGTPGPLWQRLDAQFDAYKARLRLHALEEDNNG